MPRFKYEPAIGSNDQVLEQIRSAAAHLANYLGIELNTLKSLPKI